MFKSKTYQTLKDSALDNVNLPGSKTKYNISHKHSFFPQLQAYMKIKWPSILKKKKKRDSKF